MPDSHPVDTPPFITPLDLLIRRAQNANGIAIAIPIKPYSDEKGHKVTLIIARCANTDATKCMTEAERAITFACKVHHLNKEKT